MDEIEAMDQGLTDISIDMARQGSEPGFDRIEGFAPCGKTKPVDQPLALGKFGISGFGILSHDRDGRGQIAKTDLLGTQDL